MGLMRFVLMIAVIVGHTYPIFGVETVGGVTAVQAFYLVSGFFIAMVLNEKYLKKDGGYRLYLTNRVLRIFPTYHATIVLTLLAALAVYIFFSINHPYTYYLQGNPDVISPQFTLTKAFAIHFKKLNLWSAVYVIFANVGLIGQELCEFVKLNHSDGSLFFTAFYWKGSSSPFMWEFMLVPQAWAVSLILYFYCIAPFVCNRKTLTLILLFLVCFAARFYLYQIGFHENPWNYRFFPLELALFLLGVLSYRLFLFLKNHSLLNNQFVNVSFLIFAISYTIGCQYFPNRMLFNFNVGRWCFYLYLSLSIPFMFSLSKNSKFDRYLGYLSYPIFIGHYLVHHLVHYYAWKMLGYYNLRMPWKEMESYKALCIIFGSILLGVLIHRIVDQPVESFRQKRVRLAR